MPAASITVVVLDTSVALGAGLVELLVLLHARGAVVLRWSPQIRAEIEERLPRRPTGVQQRCLRALDQVPDALLRVTPGDLAAATQVRDPDDRHVLAAGLAAVRVAAADGCGDRVVLLTRNLRDFDVEAAITVGLEIAEPDRFISELIAMAPAAFAFIDHDPEARFRTYIQRMRNDRMDKSADAMLELHEIIKSLEDGARDARPVVQ